MKTLWLTILSFALFANDLFAQKDIIYTDDELIQKLSTIGELHNKGLDYAFEKLHKKYGNTYSGGRTEKDRIEMKNFLEKTAIEFCNSSLSPNDICLDAIKKSQNGLDYRLSTLDLVSQLKNEKVAANMSQQFYDLINSLDQLVNDDSRNKNKTEVDNLIKNGIGRLTNYSEKVSLVNSVNTAYSSVSYWSSNYDKWSAFFPKGSSEMQARENPGKKIGKADIVGIITGGVGGCAYGAIGGTVVVPGVGTLAGCAALGAGGAITGGLGNSAKAAVESFIDWLVG